VCILFAAVSCLCAALCSSHHCHRAAVITVFMLQSSLSSFLSAPPQPPKCLLHVHTSESQPMSLCVYAIPLCVYIIPPCVMQREKGLGQLAVLVSTGSVETETRKGCVVHCQCLKYIYIYMYIYIYKHMYIQRERERWRGERCGALSVLEIHIYIYMYIYVHIYIQRERSREMARGER